MDMLLLAAISAVLLAIMHDHTPHRYRDEFPEWERY